MSAEAWRFLGGPVVLKGLEGCGTLCLGDAPPGPRIAREWQMKVELRDPRALTCKNSGWWLFPLRGRGGQPKSVISGLHKNKFHWVAPLMRKRLWTYSLQYPSWCWLWVRETPLENWFPCLQLVIILHYSPCRISDEEIPGDEDLLFHVLGLAGPNPQLVTSDSSNLLRWIFLYIILPWQIRGFQT